MQTSILYYDILHNTFIHRIFFWVSRSKIIRWAGHVGCMGIRNIQRSLVGGVE